MFGNGNKLMAWMGYLKDGGLDRPAASIPFDLISTDGATDEMIKFLAGMLTLAVISGPAAAEDVMEGFMRDPENFASDIDSELEEQMNAMPLSDALDRIQSVDETLMGATTLLRLLGLWQSGQAKLLQPAYTLRKLVLEPSSSRWMSIGKDSRELATVILSDAEDMAAVELTRFGVGVLLPLSADLPFDLMLHWKGRMLRAKIRTARRKNALTCFSLPAAHTNCDVIVLCDEQSVYLLKPEEFADRRRFTVRHRPTRNGRTKGCNFHEDFVLSTKRIEDVLGAA